MKVNPETVQILESYEAAGRASRALLRAALEGDWAEFDRIQERCHAIVSTLRVNGSRPHLPPAQAQRRHEILTDILADDRTIRDILEPSSRRFESMMHLRGERETSAR